MNYLIPPYTISSIVLILVLTASDRLNAMNTEKTEACGRLATSVQDARELYGALKKFQENTWNELEKAMMGAIRDDFGPSSKQLAEQEE